MTERNATADVLIAEHELLNSSADRVFEWFKNRNEQKEDVVVNWLDEEVELNLVNRNDALINQAIALFGCYEVSVGKVFRNSVEQKNEALVLCCLSNTILNKKSWVVGSKPLAIFRNDSEFEEYFKKCSLVEVATLFSNPTIKDGFLTDYLNGEIYWNSIDESKQLTSIYGLIGNARLKKEYNGLMDGWAEYSFNKVFDACWDLANKVDVTKAWAFRLGALYNNIDEGKCNKPDEALKKWKLDDQDEDKTEPKSILNPFEEVRYQLYKRGIKDLNIKSEDIACRACYYSFSDLTIQQMDDAFEQDGKVAITYMLENKEVWKDGSKREKLHELCWDADKKFESSFIEFPNDYKLKQAKMWKEYPHYFQSNVLEDGKQHFENNVLEDGKQLTWIEVEDMLIKQEGSISDSITELREYIMGLREEAGKFILTVAKAVFIFLLAYALLKDFGFIH